ncbi:TPA: 2-dehydropantoate 2-reductase N-terminal domain-containing protein [Vibrio vulnificus]
MRITVVGAGYVGLANAALLAQYHSIILLDVDSKRVEQINAKSSPIVDVDLERFLSSRALQLTATTSPQIAYHDAQLIIVATPTVTVHQQRIDTKKRDHPHWILHCLLSDHS